MPSRPKPPGPPPDESLLRRAALDHLARYGSTRTGLLRVLVRRVERWAYRAEPPPELVAGCMAAARAVVERLAAAGAVDDAAFAAGRARALHRAGRSRRAIAAYLQAKGVPAELAHQPADPGDELAAALLYASRRRMGPFRPAPDPAERPRELARLARAGFDAAVAIRALDMPPAEAEGLVLAARRG